MLQVETSPPNVGEQAPDFTLKDTNLELVQLQELRGQTVILVFFPAAFTGTCTNELCSFRDRITELNKAHATVLGISTDLPFALREFRQQQNIGFPLLSDWDHQAIEAYGIASTGFQGYSNPVARRSVFVIDPDGTVRWEWLSDNPGQEPDYDEVLKAAGS